MDLAPYVEYLRDELATAAEARGDEAAAAARRLAGPLEPAVRLMLLDALSAAADEITSELAPGSVEVRLRGGEPEFAVSAAPAPPRGEPEPAPVAPPALEGDDAATARINLRLPEQLKAAVEQAAARERLSVNSWLVRAVAASVTRDGGHAAPSRGRRSYTGWVR